MLYLTTLLCCGLALGLASDDWLEISTQDAAINSICGGDIQGLLPGVGCVGRGYDIFSLKVDPIQFGAQV